MKKLLAISILLIAALAFGQGSQFDFLMAQQRNASGSLAGGSATFYAAGSLTPKAIYSDIGLTTLASNPYTLSSQGKAMVYGSGLYKVVVKDAAGVTQYTFDYVFVNALGGFSASQTPVAGEIPVLNSDKSLKVKTGSTNRAWMRDAGAAGVRFGSLDYTTAYLTGESAVIGAGYDPLGTSSVNSAKQTLDSSGNVVVEVSTNSAVSFTNYSSWTPGRGANNSAKLSGFSAYTSAGVNRIPVSGSNGKLAVGWMAPGSLVQSVYTSVTAKTTTSTTIPFDDTIPQIGEGTQVLTMSFTPRGVGNIGDVEAVVNVSTAGTGGGDVTACALFKNSISDALVTGFSNNFTTSSEYTSTIMLKYRETFSDVSAATYTVRCGPSTGVTVTINGMGGNRYYGGTVVSYMQIKEMVP